MLFYFQQIFTWEIKEYLPMSHVPKIAYKLQSFTSVEEMNKQMNFHYRHIKELLTPSFDQVFHLLKKYSCKVPGVCWLKQGTIAQDLNVSIKTVERAIKFLKEQHIIKIYHTKRGNLNANSYYVFQPCTKFLEEEIFLVEEAEEVIVGTEEVQKPLEPQGLGELDKQEKLFRNSNLNSKINSENLSLSKIENFIQRNDQRIKEREVDIKHIYDTFHMQLVPNENVFLTVLDRVIDKFKTNFKNCLHRSLLNESNQVPQQRIPHHKPIREEKLPSWYFEESETKYETLSELETEYEALLKCSNFSNNTEQIQHKLTQLKQQIEEKKIFESKKAALEEKLKKYRQSA